MNAAQDKSKTFFLHFRPAALSLDGEGDRRAAKTLELCVYVGGAVGEG